MPYAVEMFFDKESDAQIRKIWRSLKESGISSWMEDSGSVPHVTLSVFGELDADEADRRLASFAEKVSGFPLVFASIGAFPTDEGVLFLAPVVTGELLRVHNAFHDFFADLREDQWPYYLPDSWVPHCTLAINIKWEEVHKALEHVIKIYSPLCVEVDRVALVEYHPVKVLKEYGFRESDK
jgi:2'-5' RNA ligase